LVVALVALQFVAAAPSSGQASLGTLTVDNDNPTVTEPDTGQRDTIRFRVTLNRIGPGQVNVDFRTQGGSAQIGVDYLERSGTLTFSGGETTKTVDVTVLGDNADEANETFDLVLSNPIDATLGAPANETATITDDDPLPSLRIGDISVTEGNAGEQQALFVVTLSGVSGRMATVDYATSNGTASAPGDYKNTPGTANFPPGTLTSTISVPVIGDTTDEPNENFTVTLSGAINASLDPPAGDATGLGTITDDDGPPTVSIADADLQEGNAGTKPMNFTVKLSAPSEKTVTLTADVTGVTATEPADFDGTPPPTVTFNPGDPLEKSITVDVKGDNLQEGDETFTVTLRPSADAAAGDTTAVGTIFDDDVSVISIDNVTKNEGTGLPTSFSFTVTRTGATPAPGSPISIAFATGDGTAAAPADYTATNGALAFANGDPATKQITVPVTADLLAEGTETFVVNLSQAPASPVFHIVDKQGTGTILNDDGPPAEVTIEDASVFEGTGGSKSMLFKVNVSSGFLQPVTFTFTTKDGTAVAGSDYSLTAGTIVVPSSGQATISVSVETDALDEIDETFTVELSNVQNAVVKNGTGTGTILDDDSPPAVSIANLTLVEGSGETTARGEVPVTLSAPSGRQVTVRFDPEAGTATADIDYAATGDTLTFAPGEVAKVVVVWAKGDDTDEIDEAFTLKLSNPVNAILGTATGAVTITDDDDPPVLDLDDATADEPAAVGEEGDLVFEAVLTAVSGKAVTFNFATADGTATAGPDYQSASGSVTIPAGQGGASITVVMKGDDSDENSETLTVALSGVTNATGPAGPATGTIRDNDGTPTFSITGTTVVEGTGPDGTATLTVTLLPAAASAVAVDYGTANGTATSGGANDYLQKNGTLNFAAGITSQTVAITIKADNNDEVDEAFTVGLSNNSPSAAIDSGASTATVGITDDDGPTVTVTGPATPVTEGNSGVTDATFTVALSAASVQEVRVGYATSSGTASSGTDYTPANDTLVFDAGQTSKPVTVKVLGDTVPEEDETFSLGLGQVTNATIATGSAAATITDDDRPALTIADTAVVEGNAGTTQATFTLTLSAPADLGLAVDYATAEATATDPEDFVATTGKVVFAAGERTKTVTVPVVAETAEEADETFTVTISGVDATVVAVQRATATGTIVDDDSSPDVKVTGLAAAGGVPGSDATVTEGTGVDVEAILQVTLENPRAYSVKVRYEAASGSAAKVADFTAVAGELVFEPGSVTKTLAVAVSGDSLDERTESFSLVLSQPDRAVLADPEGVVSILDDDKPGYFMSATDGGIFNFGDAGFHGSTGAVRLNQPIVGAAGHPSGRGYWLVAADGGIFTFGEAEFFGSTGAVKLNKPIVGMAPTPSGKGYWLVATDGGIFTFGDAAFHGSTGAVKLNKPVAGMASTPSGKGYWLVATDGGIFTFGDAGFHGSTGAVKLNQPIVGMASTPSGKGYWLVATDGGIFTFGDAKFQGSTGAVKLNRPIVGMAPTPSGAGYWLVADDGGIFTFGDAVFMGSTGAVKLNKPVVGMASL
jgi:hypothetical protein